MIGILGGMGTQAGLDFCNKLAKLNRGKLDQQYPMFVLYNKSNTPKRPENLKKYYNVLKSLVDGCKMLQKNNCKFIVMPCNTAHYWHESGAGLSLRHYHLKINILRDIIDFTPYKTP